MKSLTVNDILKFEKSHKLKERSIYGINYWYCRRTRTLNDIISMACGQQGMCDKEKVKKIKFFMDRNYIGKEYNNVDVLMITDARRIKQEEKYESIYTDEIEALIKDKLKCLTLEEPSWTSYINMYESHHYNCTTENIKYVDLYELQAKIKIQIFKRLNIIKLKHISDEIEHLIDEINEYFDIDVSSIKQDFIEHIIYFIVMKKKYSKLINRLNPKCIIFYYRDFPFKTLIQMIAKEKNIPTIEMQHGTYTEDEPIEKKGDSNEEWKNKPDYLFSFGKLQTTTSSLIYKENQIKFIGNLFLERKRNENIKLPKWVTETNRYILIISQSSMGEYISKFASELAESLRNTNYKIIYKFHPNEAGREYECLNKENIIQVKDSSEEIYKYQKICYIQVGISSTAIFEGLSFFLPTILLENPEGAYGIEKILKQFKKGIYYASDIEEVLKIIEKKIEKPTVEDVDGLWEKNSSANFFRELKRIIEY